jgi:1-pyrroline-5-carboxylate dehydrogenase
MNCISQVPPPINEPVYDYAPGSRQRAQLRAALQRMAGERRDLPLVIGGQVRHRDHTVAVRAPHNHRLVLGHSSTATADDVHDAIDAALRARRTWAEMPLDSRAAVFLRAAELIAGRYRPLLNAATMLGQSKTAYQAEIDSACELVDFFRFNVFFAQQLMAEQPASARATWNRLDYRPLDGFVLAITPFNFTAIAGNLPTAPALMGNTVVWKPARTAALSNQIVMDILREAGLPDGVINLVHGDGDPVGAVALSHPDLAGVHFTGSTAVFQHLWRAVSSNLTRYRSYPRLVGETGGKDFILAHASADVDALAVAIVRGAFEYQGQKCSAASRVYVPEGMWGALAERLDAHLRAITVGDVADFTHFMGAVIDDRAFARARRTIELARNDGSTTVWRGGGCDDAVGYFIEPTVVLTDDPGHILMCEEIFAPIVTVFRYPDSAYADTLRLCDRTSPYALTGAVFARDAAAVDLALRELRFAAGNFYINDKPTGAVVGQQPFGGGRASGTNDKAGSPLNLLRWVSPRTIKENLAPSLSVGYPHMQRE